MEAGEGWLDILSLLACLRSKWILDLEAGVVLGSGIGWGVEMSVCGSLLGPGVVLFEETDETHGSNEDSDCYVDMQRDGVGELEFCHGYFRIEGVGRLMCRKGVRLRVLGSSTLYASRFIKRRQTSATSSLPLCSLVVLKSSLPIVLLHLTLESVDLPSVLGGSFNRFGF